MTLYINGNKIVNSLVIDGNIGTSYPYPPIFLPIQQASVGGTNYSVELLSRTISEASTIIICVTGLTDCGSNEAYISLLKNSTEVERFTLITDTSTTHNFAQMDVAIGDIISLKFGWVNNHTASFDGTYGFGVVATRPTIGVYSGKINLTTGAIVSDSDYYYTDYIPFSNGYQMFDFGETASSYVGCVWYKEDGTYGGDYWASNARYRYVNNSSYYSGSSIRKQRLTFRAVNLDRVILFDEVNKITYTFNPYKMEI